MNIKGFKVNFLGDSITEGVGVVDRANCRYDKRLEKMCELSKVNNYGIGGTRLAHQQHASEKPRHDLCFCGRVYNMDKTADMVVVYGGVNDYFHGDAPIGSMTDNTPATFCGAVRFLMTTLKTRFAGKTVVFMTPARCFYKNIPDTCRSERSMKLADAMPVLGYVDIIKQIGAEEGVPVLDLYHTLPIDPNDPEQRAKYTADGLHFNDEGHKILAARLAEFLGAL